MAKKSHIIRTAFTEKQYEDVLYLMTEFREDTAHDLIRMIVKRVAEEKRDAQLRYGAGEKKPDVPRETKEQRIKRRIEELRAMSDADLTKALLEAKVIEEDPNSGFTSWVETDELGRRFVLYKSASEKGNLGSAEVYISRAAKLA